MDRERDYRLYCLLVTEFHHFGFLLSKLNSRKNRFSESLKSLIPEEKEDYANEVTILH